MLLRRQGASSEVEETFMSLSEEKLHAILRLYFYPAYTYAGLEEIEREFNETFGEGGGGRPDLEAFRQAFRKLMIEDPRSFEDIAFEYLEYCESEEWLEGYFHRIWPLIMGNEPWPEETVRNGKR
jgi:hypothetical protein